MILLGGTRRCAGRVAARSGAYNSGASSRSPSGCGCSSRTYSSSSSSIGCRVGSMIRRKVLGMGSDFERMLLRLRALTSTASTSAAIEMGSCAETSSARVADAPDTSSSGGITDGGKTGFVFFVPFRLRRFLS